jgi:cytochrome c
MRTLAITFTLASFLTGVALSQGDKEKGKTTVEVKAMMQKTHKGNDSPLGKISTQLKADTPDWAELTKQTKEMTALVDLLGEYKDADAKAVKMYQKGVTGLEAAVSKKDKAGAVEARKVFLQSCARCHYGGAPKSTGGGRK